MRVRDESKSLGRISSVLPALTAWEHSLPEPVAVGDLGLALVGAQGHPWLTQPLFNSHGCSLIGGGGGTARSVSRPLVLQSPPSLAEGLPAPCCSGPYSVGVAGGGGQWGAPLISPLF